MTSWHYWWSVGLMPYAAIAVVLTYRIWYRNGPPSLAAALANSGGMVSTVAVEPPPESGELAPAASPIEGPAEPVAYDASFRTCYHSKAKAISTYVLGLFTFYYAAYVVVSMLARKLSPDEVLFHLAWWTLVPPSWFFIEWFIWFDNHDTPGAAQTLRTNQELASKFWAAVLALMISLKIVEALKPVVPVQVTPGQHQSNDSGGRNSNSPLH